MASMACRATHLKWSRALCLGFEGLPNPLELANVCKAKRRLPSTTKAIFLVGSI